MAFEERSTEALGSVPGFLVDQSQKRRTVLLAIQGPAKGAVFPIEKDSLTLGRSAQLADVVLEGRGLSRAHARLNRVDGVLYIIDLNSTNGVFVNGERVTESVVRNGDVVALGPEVALRLETPDETVRELLEDLYTGATKDGLTGVLNRKSFLHRLQEEFSATRRHKLEAAVALLDVDHFKSINDTYGHPAGDAVLIQLAERVGSSLRAEDILARYGGEEFIVLLRHTPVSGAMTVADRVREQVAAIPFVVPTPDGDRAITVTVSIGLAKLETDSHWEAAIKKADEALYTSKSEGRNRVTRART